jgi:hypothetical protein
MVPIIYKPSLEKLEPGTVPLQVPLEGDVFQLAMLRRDETPMGCLLVRIEEDAIILSREDQRALQIDDNDEPTGPPERRKRSKLFDDPIGELMLSGIVPSRGLWRVHGEGLYIPDLVRFDKFMTQIFWSTYSSQKPEAKTADIMAILDKDDDKPELLDTLEPHLADS